MKDYLTTSNIMFIITGIYFAVLVAIGESSPYAIAGTVLCFVAVGLVFVGDMFFVAPWRVATASFCAVVLVWQLISNAFAAGFTINLAVSTIVNGILFILMLGVLLSTAKEITTVGAEELEEEEAKKEKESERKESKKKLTYEV